MMALGDSKTEVEAITEDLQEYRFTNDTRFTHISFWQLLKNYSCMPTSTVQVLMISLIM
ncbi:hypothetical protein Hanom_Chr16g01425871 [Helianthus anomalus]